MQNWPRSSKTPPQDVADEMSEESAIPDQKTLMLVNTFILQTVQLLNRFAITCERKLAEVSRKRHGVEIRIALLEAQLRSLDRPPVPLPASTLSSQEGLGTPPPEAGDNSRPATPAASDTPELLSESDVFQGQQQLKEGGEKEGEKEGERTASSSSPEVPKGVKRQMRSEGLDPSLLDDPDGPSPAE